MGTDFTFDHAADLAAMLPPQSRTAVKARPENAWSAAEYMLAGIEYSLAFIAWTKTKDAERGTNKPKPRATPAELAAMSARVQATDTDEIDRALGY